MELHPHIFREYDIRGIVGRDFSSEVAEAVGRAYGLTLARRIGESSPRIALGQDNRPSSPDLAGGFARGLVAAGARVLELGTVPTPVTYWAEHHLAAHGAVMITGSHNPPEWNGIKMTMEGRALYGKDVRELRLLALEDGSVPGGGSVEGAPILEKYVEAVAETNRLSRPVKLAVDCGNGTSSVVAERLLQAVGAQVLPLYCESDGTFPNHHPDPTVDENLVDLISLVREEGAEAGIAFDGDGDRIGVVDDRGRVVRGDILLLLFGLDLLERRGEGTPIVFDVKCSQVLPEVLEARGGRPIMWKTGHSLIKEKMKEEGAPLAGELSGHICFADEFIGTDDALYAACRLARLLESEGRPLSSLVDELPRYVSTPEIRIEVTEEAKAKIVEAALAHFRSQHDVIDVDGVRILFGDGWGLLRASNTQPVLVARYEAKSEERLAEIRGEVEGWLREQGVDV